MTDEERKKLVQWLRDMDHLTPAWQYQEAANELERLAAENEKLRNRPLTIAPRVMDNGEIR